MKGYWIDFETDIRYAGLNEEGKETWELLTELTYGINSKEGKERIIVPEGYISDGATIPRMMWSIIPPLGNFIPAVFVHDILCLTKGNLKPRYNNLYLDKGLVPPEPLSSKETHEIFRQAMLNLTGSGYTIEPWRITLMGLATKYLGPRW